MREASHGGYSIEAGFCKIRWISKGGADGISVKKKIPKNLDSEKVVF